MVKINKKAMEMSLNLIIMLIIGMVILGLVIGFVNSMMSKGTESFDKQLGDNEKLKLDEVRNCPDNLCVSPYPSVSVKKGGKSNIFIKARAYGDPISCKAGDLNANVCSVTYEVLDSNGDAITGMILSGPGFDAKDGVDDAKMYTLITDGTIPVGTYYLQINLYPEVDKISKSMTIEVK